MPEGRFLPEFFQEFSEGGSISHIFTKIGTKRHGHGVFPFFDHGFLRSGRCPEDLSKGYHPHFGREPEASLDNIVLKMFSC